MRLKRTNSFTRSENHIEQTMMETRPYQMHQTLLQSNQQTVQRHHPQLSRPQPSLSFISHLTKSYEKPMENTIDNTRSMIGTLVRSRVKQVLSTVRSKAICQMCDGDIVVPKGKNNEIFMCRCDHRNNYCESCLLQYVIYHVKQSEQVLCPHQGCNTLLDTSTPFFKNLPIQIQKNYISLRSFMMKSQDRNIKLCPRWPCNGILTMHHHHYVMICSHCNNVFCPRCLGSVHQGCCRPYQVQFFQSSMRFHQCPRCQIMITKKEGSNLLKCKCGVQLCYVCRRPWTLTHEGRHNEYGQVIISYGQKQIEFEQDDNNRIKLTSILKIPLKILLFLTYVPLILLLYLVRDLLILIFMMLFSIIAGLFGFSLELVSKTQGILCLLSVLFFPITMVIGVGVGFREVLCEMYPQVGSSFCDSVSKRAEDICKI